MKKSFNKKMSTIKIFLYILIFLLVISNLENEIYPQQSDIKFRQLSLQEGVANNLTYCMIKDSKGFLWFGTMYGLARYDGSGYIIFKHDPEDNTSISFDDIVSLFEDREGNIWIGTWGGGLNKYNPYEGKFTSFIYQDDNPDGIDDNIVWAICEDKEGNIWLGTERGGLNKYNPDSGKFVKYQHDESNRNSICSNSIYSLLCDSSGDIWIVSDKGLSRFNYKKKSFENFTNNPDNNNSISPGIVRVLYEDHDKNLWVGTSSGLNEYDKISGFKRYFSEPTTNSLTNNFIISITSDSYNNLWIGTARGLNYFDKKTNRITRFFHDPDDSTTLCGNVIYNVLEDNSGTLWVNAYNKGISKSVKPKSTNFYNFESFLSDRNSLSNNYVLSLTEAKDGNLWAGTMNGLNHLNLQNKNVEQVKVPGNIRSGIISSLAADADGTIWVGSYDGLRLFNPITKNFHKLTLKESGETKLLATRITSLLIDSNIVWIGTYSNGLFKLDRNNNSVSRFSFEGKQFSNYQADYILALYKDKANRIWIGSFGGLTMYDQEKKSFYSYTSSLNDKSSLSNNYVFSIFEDSRDEIWIGTSNGLNKLVSSKEGFEHFFEKDGLPNSVISAITEDQNGNLWISTNKGLSKYNYKQKSFTNYDMTDGVGGNLFNTSVCIKGKKGEITFGGNWGLTVFYPDKMSFSNYNPPVYVSSIKEINNDGDVRLITSFKNEIEIKSTVKTIVINFASLDFSNPSKNRFIYKMEGIDNDWVNAGNNSYTTYTSLEPGEYTINVRGTNSDGILSNSIAKLNIIVVPEFWQTLWFKILLILILITISFFVVRRRIANKIKREIEIQKIREEESEKLRRKTAIDFHDEMGHRLTRITLLTEMIRRKLQNTFSEIDPLLDKISENSHHLYDGTKDFIWAINPEHDTLYDLIIRLKDFGDELFSDTDIKFSINGVDENLNKLFLNIDWKRHLILIFKEAMNNVLRHSDCKNTKLEVSVNNNKVQVFLFDDGNGFDAGKSFVGNGLKNMKLRAEKIDGKLEIDSHPKTGTKISFRGIIPYIYLDYNRKVA